MNRFRTIVLVLFVVGLAGCSSSSTATLDSTPTSVETFTSPITFDSPLDEPIIDAPTPTLIPSPPQDKGAIIGQLVEYESGKPIRERGIFIGDISPIETDKPDTHLVMMNPSSAPGTKSDPYGYFAIQDIAPGTYALVIWTPAHSQVISDPETSLDMLITVNAGEITDVGKVVFRYTGQ